MTPSGRRCWVRRRPFGYEASARHYTGRNSMSDCELSPFRCCIRIVRTDCTWIDGESVAAGVECATGATAAIDLSRHRNSDWHPLGSVEKDSECVDCMIYSEWNAHSSVAAAVAFAVAVVVAAAVVAAAVVAAVVAVVAVAVVAVVVAAVVVAAVVVAAAVVAAVVVAAPSIVNSGAGFVSVPLEPPGGQQPLPSDDRVRPCHVHPVEEYAGVRDGDRHPSVWWMSHGVQKASVHGRPSSRRM